MESEGDDYDEEEKSDFIYVFPDKKSYKKKKIAPIKEAPTDLPLRDETTHRALIEK
jgi:hypothetical protein